LLFIDIIVNKIIAGRTKQERMLAAKKYRIENADKIRERDKKYNLENADMIRERARDYYLQNRDKIKEYRLDNVDKFIKYRLDNVDTIRENIKEYYVKNRDTIRARNNEKITCECGAKIAIGNKARHEKNEKHQKRVELIINEVK